MHNSAAKTYSYILAAGAKSRGLFAICEQKVFGPRARRAIILPSVLNIGKNGYISK